MASIRFYLTRDLCDEGGHKRRVNADNTKVKAKRNDGTKHIMEVGVGDSVYLHEVCKKSNKVKCGKRNSLRIDSILDMGSDDFAVWSRNGSVPLVFYYQEVLWGTEEVPEILQGLVAKVLITGKVSAGKVSKKKKMNDGGLFSSSTAKAVIYRHGKFKIASKKFKNAMSLYEKIQEKFD